MYNKKERERYNVSRQKTCQRLGITKNEYNLFRRLGGRLHYIYECNCNGDYQTEKEYETAYEGFEGKAKALATKKGLHIFFQTDPRGCSIYLDIKEIADNNYNSAEAIY